MLSAKSTVATLLYPRFLLGKEKDTWTTLEVPLPLISTYG